VVTRIIGWGRLATIVTAGLFGVRVTVAVPAIFIGGVLWLYFGFLVVHTTGIHIKRIIRSFWGRWWELGIILGIVLIVSVGYLVLRIRLDRKPKGE
jgi:hypothetical protein